MYRYSVIIADDEIANVRGVSRLLERECPEVRITGTYDNGKSVIEHLEREPVDIAILDIRMPEATGMEVATWIFEKRLDTSVILMTGYREFEYAKQAVNVGVEAFWEKPLNLKEAVAHKRNRLFRLQKTSDEFAGKIHDAPHLSVYADSIIHIIPAFRVVVNG